MKFLLFTVSAVLAFLLFSVQPMASKMLLPTLGGAPAVWTTAMCTFQALLLAGYAYAHALVAHVTPRWQLRIHAMVIALSCAVLPLAVHLPTSEAMLAQPIPYLVAALMVQAGLPFLALAATQPLLQSWLARSGRAEAENPYVLYSASNLGSFTGLLGYVVVVEPLMNLSEQSEGWSVLYVGAMLLLVMAGHRLRPAGAAQKEVAAKLPHLWKRYLVWVWLAFLPSSLSLGVTTYITTDVASVPLLWIIPLAVYLLSFVEAFRTRPWFIRPAQHLAPLAGMAALIMYGLQVHRFAFGFPLHLAAFTLLAFALHGWLAQRKPEPAQLTRFYLCLSVGGMLGGLLNGLLAPMLLKDALEYPVVLMVASLMAFLLRQQGQGGRWWMRELWTVVQVVGLVLAMTVVLYLMMGFVDGTERADGRIHGQNLIMSASIAAMITLVTQRRYTKAFYACTAVGMVMLVALSYGVVGYAMQFKDRNFFGVERVYENANLKARYIMHGTTLHGLQATEPGMATTPLSYYNSIGELFDALPVMRAHPMAVVGLGIGSMKCQAGAKQQVDFFEINPMVQQLAEDTRFFQQLAECPGTYRVVLGDGRLMVAEEPDGKYGLIMLDAFSSDAIPAHLITREAMEMYLRKLAQGGILLVHTTNRHLDLWPLLASHAQEQEVEAFGKFFEGGQPAERRHSSYWVVMTTDAKTRLPDGWEPLKQEGHAVWTDQYSNILPYIKMLR